jgi:SET domain-containing protein
MYVAPYCIAVGREEYESHMRFTVLEHHLFNDQGGNKLLALGYGSLFNHSRSPNVDYRIQEGNSNIYSSDHKEILQGEELCISYGANLWFDDADGADDSSDSSEEIWRTELLDSSGE